MVAAATFRGVVFDMDGILIDSEPLFRVVGQRAARDLGFEMSDEFYLRLMGLPPAAVEAAIRESLGAAFPMEEFRTRFMEIWPQHTSAHGVPAQPGMLDLLRELTARRIPFGVATSTRRQQALRSLELAGLLEYIDTLVCGDEVDRGKPAPDIFLRAADTIGLAATRCVALEDSEAGLRAAAAARMLTIMVPDLHRPSPEVAALARYILPSTAHAARVVTAIFDEPAH